MADPALVPSDVVPMRNPSLVDRIAGLFNRAQPRLGPQPAEQQTTQTGFTSPSEAMHEIWNQYFKGDDTRKAVYLDAEKMDKNSEEASRALDTIANNAVTSEDGAQQSFEVHSDNQVVQDELDDLIARARLHQRIKPFFRNLVKNGDVFWEPVINGNLDVVKVKQLPPTTIFRNEDQFGDLKMGQPKSGPDGRPTNKQEECAFEQRGEQDQLIATFWPWQIVHARHNYDDLSKYGKSLFWVARQTWKKLKSMEEGLVIGRLTRDLMKLVFYIDSTGLTPSEKTAALAEFKRSLNQRTRIDGKRENPFSVMTDFFLTRGYLKAPDGKLYPQQTGVEVIDPKNAGLHNIDDIEYFHRKFISELLVPPAHMSFEKDVNAKGTVTAQDVQYVRILRALQQDASLALEQIFDLQLILRGINPLDTANAYVITWPALKATDEGADAQAAVAYAQRDQIHIQEGVISPEWVMRHTYGMDDEEIAQVQEEIAEAEQRELDNLASQAQIGVQVQNSVVAGTGQAGGSVPAGAAQPSVPQDADGERKGDEGRTRDGKRIAPTKSKPKGTPTGSKASPKKKPKALAEANRQLLGWLADLDGPAPRRTLQVEATTPEDVVSDPRRSHLDIVRDGLERRARLLAEFTPETPQDPPVLRVLTAEEPAPAPAPPAPVTHVEIHLDEGMLKSEQVHHHHHETHIEVPAQKAPEVTVDVKVPEQRAPEIHNHVEVAPATPANVEVRAEIAVPEQKAPVIQNHIEVAAEEPVDFQVKRDDTGRVSEIRPRKQKN